MTRLCPLTAKVFFASNLIFIWLVGTNTKTIGQDDSDSLNGLVNIIQSSDDAAVQAALLQGMLSGLEGRRNVTPPMGWSGLAKKLSKSKNKTVLELTTQLSQIFGDKDALLKSIAVLRDTSAKPTDRRRALRSLLAQKNKAASEILESLLDHPELQLDAIRGYASVENPKAPAILLARFSKLNPQNQKAVVETLASRKIYANALLTALREKKIKREDIPVQVARSLSLTLGTAFEDVYGKIKSVGADREKQIAKYKKLLRPEAMETANASRGRVVFNKTCASCHTLYGEGGKVGPDLTGSNRANLDYILLNSVDPSYDVPEGYKAELISTLDGLLITGVIAEEDGTKVVLKTAEQPRVVIAKEDIENRKTSDKSIMPDGQLDELKTQQVLDLIKYLRTTEQVELEK
jgi:putative heme-binding domain-containing protein